MAFYSPNNEYLIPRPWLISQCSSDVFKYFAYGATYGAVMSAMFSNPMPRAVKFTLGWATFFTLGYTRGLYNSPGFVKRTDVFRPDLDRDADWITDRQIKKYFPRADVVDDDTGSRY